MTIDVRVDRLVLDGMTLSRRERDELGPAIQRELGLLTRARPATGRHRAGSSKVDGIARNVALAVHGAIAPAKPPTGTTAPAPAPRTAAVRR